MIKIYKCLLLIGISQFSYAQQWKNLVYETFGTQTTPDTRSQNPTQDLLPGTTNYTPLTANLGTYSFNDGYYMVGSSSAAPRSANNPSNSYLSGILDHTIDPPGVYGNLFAINANPDKKGEDNGSYYKYETSLFDLPGAVYKITFYAANLLKFNGIGKPGHIGLSIKNVGATPTTIHNVNSWVLPKTTDASNSTLPWQENSVDFSLPLDYAANSLTFNFFNTDPDPNNSTSGNDLVIDDITIQMRVIKVEGKVFIDENENGVQDALDANFNGSTQPLFVYAINPSNIILAKTRVNADGTYLFSNDNGVPYSDVNMALRIIISSTDLAEGNAISQATINNRIIVSENISFSNSPSNLSINQPKDGIINLLRNNIDFTQVNFGLKALCYQPATTSGTTYETKQGITSLQRAGDENGNWPMVRKGGHLALESKTKPFVPNRLSITQINAIPTANLIDGMMVFDTDNKCLKIYVKDDTNPTNSGWKCFTEQTCPE